MERLTRVIEYEECESTNATAKSLAVSGAPHMTAVVARTQTAGRGRRGRNWQSAEGGLYMSVIIREKLDKPQRLTVAACLAVFGVLRALGADCVIKWPNDIMCKGEKLCGILAEYMGGAEPFAVVGIGVNVRNEPSVGVSLSQLGINAERLCVAKAIAQALSDTMELGFERVLREYEKNLDTIGKRVTVTGGAEAFTAVAKAVDADGMLIVERNGKAQTVMSGDVTIRPA